MAGPSVNATAAPYAPAEERLPGQQQFWEQRCVGGNWGDLSISKWPPLSPTPRLTAERGGAPLPRKCAPPLKLD